MFRDLMIALYGDTKYGLLISPGNESGFTALHDIVAIRTQTWGDFIDVIDDLVENPEENEFKMIAIDTVDELVDIAIEKTMKVHYQRKKEKCKSINDALGGYGAGRKYVISIINKQIQRLENAGLGLIFIGHTKIRDIKQKNLSDTYQSLTSNLESGYDAIFKNKADIVATLYIDREIVGKVQTGTERYIYFRGTDFVDAGTRFKGMPERVIMTAENYIEAFDTGVKNSFGSKVSDAKLEKLRKKESDVRDKKSKVNAKKEKTGSPELADGLKSVSDYRSQIEKNLKELDTEMKAQKKIELSESGVPTNYKEIDDIKILKVILKTVLA